MGYGGYVAAAAEVSVKDDKVKMHRIMAATNCGHAVNPAQIERQIAGSFVLWFVRAVPAASQSRTGPLSNQLGTTTPANGRNAACGIDHHADQ